MLRLACGVLASGVVVAVLTLWGPWVADDGVSVAQAGLRGAAFGLALLPFELVRRRRSRHES